MQTVKLVFSLLIFVQGYHSCLIAYGSPGSGKSHALFGKASSGKYKGLIIRAAETMMATLDKSEDSETKAEVSMSFVQIYNEKIYDILVRFIIS